MSAKLIGIVAMTSDRVIGKGNDLPWHLPDDLKFFKKTTLNSPIVMGRKTFDSIGKPLPKRRNIVMTRDTNWTREGVEVIHDVQDLLDITSNEEQVFIIGGAEVYRIYLERLDELIVTHVSKKYEGDTYFPKFEQGFEKNETLMTHNDFKVIKYFH